MRHIVEKRYILFCGEVVQAEVYVLDGRPMEVFLDFLDTPLDARLIEFVDAPRDIVAGDTARTSDNS
jgi:hypothetical protein